MSLQLSALAKLTGDKLKNRRFKLVVAESCTGGGLAYWITSIAGSSDWFDRGYITYQNEAKQEMLGVSDLSLQNDGAVSEQVAIEMAQQALAKSHAQVSIAITGIAGPTGGSAQKPVGLVWIAWVIDQKLFTQKNIFAGDRAAIREQAIECAMKKLVGEL